MHFPARAFFAALTLSLLVADSAAAASVAELLALGDEAYARRAEGCEGLWAESAPVSEAIAAFEGALAMEPGNHEARTKLLESLFYRGDYVLRSLDTKLEAFERGQTLGAEGMRRLIGEGNLDPRGGKDYDRLLEHLEGQPGAAGIYYWTAVHWGVWGRHRGKIAAARQGVAGRIRDYARIVNGLEPEFLHGSGHRLLGRLHAEAPRIPFVTGWIDHDLATSELETARSLADDPLTQLYFIEALLDYDRSRRGEAMKLLRDLVKTESEPCDPLEDLRALEDARILLESKGG